MPLNGDQPPGCRNVKYMDSSLVFNRATKLNSNPSAPPRTTVPLAVICNVLRGAPGGGEGRGTTVSHLERVVVAEEEDEPRPVLAAVDLG